MKKIRIAHPTTLAGLSLEPGDEIHVAKLSPELKSLVTATRLDGVTVAHLVGDDDDDEEHADAAELVGVEKAVMGRGSGRSPRTSSVS